MDGAFSHRRLIKLNSHNSVITKKNVKKMGTKTIAPAEGVQANTERQNLFVRLYRKVIPAAGKPQGTVLAKPEKTYVTANERLDELLKIPVNKRTVLQAAEISAIAHTKEFGVDLGSVLRLHRRAGTRSPEALSQGATQREIGY